MTWVGAEPWLAVEQHYHWRGACGCYASCAWIKKDVVGALVKEAAVVRVFGGEAIATVVVITKANGRVLEAKYFLIAIAVFEQHNKLILLHALEHVANSCGVFRYGERKGVGGGGTFFGDVFAAFYFGAFEGDIPNYHASASGKDDVAINYIVNRLGDGNDICCAAHLQLREPREVVAR